MRLTLALMISCGSAIDDEDDGGEGIVIGGGGADPTMADCMDWLAQSQSVDIPHQCSTDEYRGIVEALGGAIFPVGTDRYYVAWFPQDWDGASVIYAVHGSIGCAEMMADLFAEAASGRYAVLALQFVSQGSQDYDDEATLYDNLQAMHAEAAEHCPVERARRVYYGYSRGGGRGYGLAARDAEAAALLDAVVIDSGTSTLAALSGWGDESLRESRFWLWCGTRDPDPIDSSRTTCAVMEEDMEPWIASRSGTVDALVQEEGGCHGMFFTDCDANCDSCRRRGRDNLGPSLPLLFDYIDGL